MEASDGSEHRFDDEESGICRRVRVWTYALEHLGKHGEKATDPSAHRSVAIPAAGQVPGLYSLGNV